MTIGALGTVRRDGDEVRLEFTRVLHDPVELVWAALTEPDRVARWLGRWSGDPTSGSVQLSMSEETDAPSQIVEIESCDAPSSLAVRMSTADGVWHVSVHLEPGDRSTTLKFVQPLAEPYDASSIGPGWQFYLDRLGAVVAGTESTATWEDYYPALREAYPIPG